MLKRKLTLIALFAGIVAFAFNACEDDKNPTFYPSNVNSSENLLTPPDSEGSDTTSDSTSSEPYHIDVRVFKKDQNNAWMRDVEVYLGKSKGIPWRQAVTSEDGNGDCVTDNWRANFEVDSADTYYYWTKFQAEGPQGDSVYTYASDTLFRQINDGMVNENNAACVDLNAKRQE